MKKIARLTALIILLLISNSLFFVRVSECNFWHGFHSNSIPVPDGTGNVTISVNSPNNYTSFKTNNITLSFTASSPDPIPIPVVVENYVTLDIRSDWTESVDIIPISERGINAAIRANMSVASRSGSDYNPSVTVDIQNIPEGSHNLTIKYSRSYYTYYSAQEGDITITLYKLESSSTIFFSVSPEGSDDSSRDDFQEYSVSVPVVALIATTIVIVVLLMVNFKNHRKAKPVPVQSDDKTKVTEFL
jgi:hypothetical protein